MFHQPRLSPLTPMSRRGEWKRQWKTLAKANGTDSSGPGQCPSSRVWDREPPSLGVVAPAVSWVEGTSLTLSPVFLVTRAFSYLGKPCLGRHFTEKQLQVGGEHTIQWSALLVIREMQIQSPVCTFMAYQVGKDEKVTKSIMGVSSGTLTQPPTWQNVSWGNNLKCVRGTHSSFASSKKKTGSIQ